MQIQFAGDILECRQIDTEPSRFKLGDIVVGPNGNLLKVITVQKDCPMWESTRRVFTAFLFETETHTKVPVRNLHGTFHVLRPAGVR